TGVAGVAAVAVAATAVAVRQQSLAERNRRTAVARQLGAAALINQPLDHSLLLAASAVKIDNNVNTRSNLLAAIQRSPAAHSVWQGDGYPLYQLVLSDHDQTMIAAGHSGISTWNLGGRRTATATQLSRNGFTPLLAARPGTGEVAIANLTGDTDITYPIRLWDPRRRQQIGPDIFGLEGRASSLTWSSDGRWLAAAQQAGDVLVWDVQHRSPTPLHINRHSPDDGADRLPSPVVFPAVVYAGGDRFAIIERSGDAEVRSPGSAGPAQTFSVGRRGDIASVASDPAGTMLAVGHTTGTVTLFSLADGRLRQTLIGHSAAVGGLAFSHDGKLIASLGDDNVVNVTNLITHLVLGRSAGHTGPVTAAAFTQDDDTLYTGSIDGTVIGWDIANLNNLGSQLSEPGSAPVGWMAASPTGEVALGYPNGTVQIWARTGGSPIRPIRVSDRELIAGAFSPDGHLLAVSDGHGTARLLDVRSQRIATVARLPNPAWAVAFSPDGQKIVWVDDDGLAYYSDPVSRRQIGAPQAWLGRARQLAWSPDSRYIAVTTRRGPEAVDWHTTGGAIYGPIAVFDSGTNVQQWFNSAFQTGTTYLGVAWSPDGTTVATGGDAGAGLLLLRASDGTRVGGGWKDHALISNVAYSPDGSTIASTGYDGTVVLRDVATGVQIGPALAASYTQQASYVSFDAAGHLIVATQDGGLWRWNIDLAYLMRQACAIAGRNLTAQEWADLHTGHPYVTACDQ
ncbi:MAG TPA: WD40 repeat domain-containing protein, partial [Nocardioidaceae bacterium]|nr:WD40 repeat domain-containing protein [Nocardioidaceae bacterium]